MKARLRPGIARERLGRMDHRGAFAGLREAIHMHVEGGEDVRELTACRRHGAPAFVEHLTRLNPRRQATKSDLGGGAFPFACDQVEMRWNFTDAEFNIWRRRSAEGDRRSEEHTSELQ